MKTLTQLSALAALGSIGLIGHQVIIRATEDPALSFLLHSALFVALIANLHILNKKLEK